MRSALPLLLEKYKAAWEAHDLPILEQIFTLDIIYHEKPGVVFCGMEELKAYWKENKRKQKNVKFHVTSFIQKNNQIIADWKVEFFHLVKKKVIRLSGIMLLSLQKDKIVNFKECFFLIPE